MRIAHKMGFTLMELIMAVVIVAIMAAVALPSYVRAMEIQRCRQARDLLLTIYAGERVYASVNNNRYYNPTAAGGDWNELYMDNPAPADGSLTYTFTMGALNATFTATAKRIGGALGNNQTISINQNQAITLSVDVNGNGCPFDG
jgi:type IV pilus assembly protein PilE